jgi:hypothetical protein
MKQKITFLLLCLICCPGLFYGQTMVNDFESGSAAPLDSGGGATFAVVTNPNASGLNTTDNCLQIGRTSTAWWEYVGVNVDPDISISSSDTKFVSVMVYCSAQPDLGIRFDAPNDGAAGGKTVRALNSYTALNQWQKIVFEVKDEQTATSFTKGTLYRLTIHADIGVENDPVGKILNNSDTFAYLDQIQILDANPLSISDFELENSISLYPNPAQSTFKLETRNNIIIKEVSLYSVLGNKIQDNIIISNNECDISNLSTGLYIVKIIDENGVVATKKLFKR